MPDFQANLRKRIVEDEIFTGTGLDDLDSGGSHTLNSNTIFTVIIDSTGAPDTFKWKKGNGTFITGVAITGSVQALSDGVTIVFGATTGHTLNDMWEIQATDFGIDAVLDDVGEVLDITDHSNFVTNDQVGHGETAFESTISRLLNIVLPDESVAFLATTQTILPHWDTANTQANSDTIRYAPGGVLTDGVYELILFNFPTWSVSVDYALGDMVVRGGNVYRAILNPGVGDDPATNPSIWTVQTVYNSSTGQPHADVPSAYYDIETVVLVFNIRKCLDEKVFDSNCDISKNCIENFATDGKQVTLWKIMLTLRAIQIATKLKEYDKAQQLVVKATALCKLCTC